MQKNTDKLENLILMGYSTSRVALPYQILTVGINFAVLLIAIMALVIIRSLYSDVLAEIITGFEGNGIIMSCTVGVALFIFVSAYNIIAIRRKINAIL